MTGRAIVALVFTAYATLASAQTGAGRQPFDIVDNSFLVEEAFNQEAGVFQNIFGMTRVAGGQWDAAFTQEWPLVTERHQFSYTIPFGAIDTHRGVGDVLMHYRYQLVAGGHRWPAMSPRISIVLPSGRRDEGFGNGVVGWQANLPVSKQIGDLFVHANAGVTYLPHVRSDTMPAEWGTDLVTPVIAASAIVRLRKMVHAMCEVLVASVASLDDGGGVQRERVVTVAPGVRGGWNFGSRQVVVGVAAPIVFESGTQDAGLLTYVSYELPWR